MPKKNFTKPHNFFTDSVEQQETQIEDPKTNTKDVPLRYKPAYVEVKSKRVQLVFQPSIYEKAKNSAEKQNISLNEYIHRLIHDDCNHDDTQ